MKNKIFLIQINPAVADCKGNFEQISDAIKKIKDADLIILNKLAILGFPYFDLLKKNSFITDTQKKYLNELADITNLPILTTFIDNDKTEKTALIRNNKIEEIFDTQNNIFDLNGEKIQIETISNIKSEFNLEINLKNNINSLILFDACNSINGKEYQRNKELSKFAKLNEINIYYSNQFGSVDEYSFDGASRIYNTQGELTTRANSFDFDIINSSDTKIEKLPKGEEIKYETDKEFSLNYENDLERTYLSAIQGIKDYFSKNNFKKAVLGLSGGLDSTVSAVLLVDALGKDNVLGVSMPSTLSTQSSKDDAKDLAKNLGIEFLTIPIKEITEPTTNLLNKNFDKISNNFEANTESYVSDNIQARARAVILWGISNQYKSLFTIATSDKSELYMGYATVNGDMSGSFAPIADITKTKLFALADWMNKNRFQKNAIPESVLKKSPGAELAINKKTGKLLLAEEALMPYEFMDEVIFRLENQKWDLKSMLNSEFLYEKTHRITETTKNEWLQKFYRRMFTSTYKGHILPPTTLLEPRTINTHFKPITANKIEI